MVERPSNRVEPGLLAVLWGLVVLEGISPIPAFLTFGAAYVLLFRPPGFLRLVQRLYHPGPTGGSASPR